MDFFTFDDDYLTRLRNGDRWTVEHFVHYFNAILLIKLRWRLGSMNDINDVRQEVFARLFHSIRSGAIRDGSRLGAFVNSVCNNVLRERFRRNQRTEQLPDDYPDVEDETDIEQLFATKESVAQVRRAIEQLPRKDADLLRAIIDERDKDDLCRELDVDRGYLRVLVHRAKEKFRSEYMKMFGSDETPGGGPSLRQ